MSNIDVFLELEANSDIAISKLFDLISIPSVSSDPSQKQDIDRAAQWLKNELSLIGLSAKVVQTAGHPVVMAHSETRAEFKAPRLLFYGHYDVQPVAPIEAWTHPPFAPEIIEKDGVHRFYGRGASDSKSQLWTFIEALRAWKVVHGNFPGDIVVVLEGEEETGSPSLPSFMETHQKELDCDIAFVCDSDMWSPTQPAITTQLKGLVHEKITINAPNGDLHSGHYGGVAANPIRLLSKILSEIHDDQGRVTIDGFYDAIEDMPEATKRQWEMLSEKFDLFSDVDLRGGEIEAGYSAIEAMWGRPTVDFNGLASGNQGPGERSVLPSSATARVTFRLVPGQDPELIRAAFQQFVKSRLPDGCTVDFEGIGGSGAVVLSQENSFLQATAHGLEKEWGLPTVLKGTGGTIPIVQQLSDGLGINCVVVGFILASDAIHGPDENYDTERFHKGTRSWVRIFDELEHEDN